MAEKRIFTRTLCAKTGAKTVAKIEMFPAEQWAESAQEAAALAGRFRLRVNRRWLDLPEGGMAFLDARQIGMQAAALALGEIPALEAAPDLPRGSAVSAPTGRMIYGECETNGTRTVTEPIRGYDGRWYVAVLLWGKGTVFARVDELRRKK